MNDLTNALSTNDLDTICAAINALDLPVGYAADVAPVSIDAGNDWREVVWLGWDDSDDGLQVWVEGGSLLSQDSPEMAYDVDEVEKQILDAVKSAWNQHNDETKITDEDIRSLRDEAIMAGDSPTHLLGKAALAGDEVARAICAEIILGARAMED